MTYEQALSTFIIEEGLTPPLRREQERLFQKGFQAGAASRDAEVARLKTVPMKYRRMAFNAQLQNEIEELVAALEHILAGSLSLPRFAEAEAIAVIAKVRKP